MCRITELCDNCIQIELGITRHLPPPPGSRVSSRDLVHRLHVPSRHFAPGEKGYWDLFYAVLTSQSHRRRDLMMLLRVDV